MTEPSLIRVLIVLPHPLFREGIATVINNQADMLLVAEAASASEAYEHFDSHRPDVTLMDFRLPDSSGIGAMDTIRARCANAPVILLCNFDGDLEIQHALDAGASACILKTMHPKQITDAIRSAHAGENNLAPLTAAPSSR